MEPCAILLLDDDEDDYQILKSLIRDAFHGTVKLDWFQRDGFANVMICSGDYVLTLIEYQLSGENGLDVIRKAKAQCPDQKIFLLTSWNDQVVTDDRAHEAGTDMVLRKASLSTDLVQRLITPHLERSGC